MVFTSEAPLSTFFKRFVYCCQAARNRDAGTQNEAISGVEGLVLLQKQKKNANMINYYLLIDIMNFTVMPSTPCEVRLKLDKHTWMRQGSTYQVLNRCAHPCV